LLAAGLNRRLVRADGEWRVAVPFECGSVASLAVEHRRVVLEALSAAGISSRMSDDDAVRVAYGDRAAALAALGAEAVYAADPLYISAGRASKLLDSIDGSADARFDAASAWSVFRYHWLSDRLVIGEEQACRIEFDDGRPGTFGGSRSATIDFDVDVVYTWVDGTDAEWKRSYEEARRLLPPESAHALAANPSRYRNRDEMRYSLRSLALHAPWVRRVFVVTCGHVPPWLYDDDERVRVVHHDEILDAGCLPTFNSHAIETALHHIDGLAEHYLYLNDDVFLGRSVMPSLFFGPDGRPIFFPDETAPIPRGSATVDDAPVDAAAKNVRDLIGARFGMIPDLKALHVAHPQTKSILVEIEQELAEELASTASSRFRSAGDLSVASCLSHYYALATNRARRGSLSSEYVNVADRWAPIKMERLLALRDRDVFCLNETHVPERRVERVDRMVKRFLNDYFPVASPFEVGASQSRRS